MASVMPSTDWSFKSDALFKSIAPAVAVAVEALDLVIDFDVGDPVLAAALERPERRAISVRA